MSFYINPIQLNQPQFIVNQPNTPLISQGFNPYVTNPYDVSFYTQSVLYPYNPVFNSNISDKYRSLGTIKSETGENVYLYELKSGQKVAILPTKNKSTIVKTFLDAGSMNETDSKRGVMHGIEHCLFKGSEKLADGDVFRLTGLMGATTNASTDYAKVDYYISAPYMNKKDLETAIKIQGDMISTPIFDTKAIESEKAPICSEISMMNDDPMSFAFDRAVRNLFQIKSNSDNLVAGSIETVSNLTREDFINYHQSCYAPSNLKTVVVGDVNPAETIELIANNFTIKANDKNNSLAQFTNLNPITSSTRQDFKSSKTNSTTSFLAFSGPKPNNAKDAMIASLLINYLQNFSTSSLKKGLENINGFSDVAMQKVSTDENDPQAFIFMLQTNPGEEQKAIDLFYNEIQKIQAYSISDIDLNALKMNSMKNYEIQKTSSEYICDILGDSFMNEDFSYYSRRNELLNAITKQDIADFAYKYLNLNQASIVVVHPQNVSNEEINQNYNNSKFSLRPQSSANIAFCGTPKVSLDNIREYNLQNNANIILSESNSNLCVFDWSIDIPPIKPKNPNIPAILSYIFSIGTSIHSQDEIDRFKELNAIDLFVNTTGKNIQISADCTPENTEKMLQLMNEIMYSPNFSEKTFNEAKAHVKAVLKAQQKDANSNLLSNLYPGYFTTTQTKLKELDKLELQDVVDFYNTILSNSTSHFVASAPFSTHPTISQSIINNQNQSKYIFKDSTPKLSPIFEANKVANVVYDTDDLNQAQIYKSYKFPLSGNIEDEAKFEIVNSILGASASARLFQDLRDKQNLAYTVGSTIRSFENTGIITLRIKTTTDDPNSKNDSFDNVQKSIEGFNKHINLLKTELVSDEELNSAKNQLKQDLIANLQNPILATSLLSFNSKEPYGIQRIEKYIQAIDKITKEDVRNAAQFMFSFNPTTSILASENTIKSQYEYLKTQGVMQQA